MESVGDVLKDHPSRFQYQDLVQQIVKDPDVAAFIQKESLSQEELNRSISKFMLMISFVILLILNIMQWTLSRRAGARV